MSFSAAAFGFSSIGEERTAMATTKHNHHYGFELP
jgi:hypothetical protein